MFLAQTVDQIKDIATEGGYTLPGVLLLLLLALGFGGYKVLKWLGVRFDQVLDRGFKHLDTVDATMGSLKESIGGIGVRLDSMEDKIDNLGDRVDNLDDHIARKKEVA